MGTDRTGLYIMVFISMLASCSASDAVRPAKDSLAKLEIMQKNISDIQSDNMKLRRLLVTSLVRLGMNQDEIHKVLNLGEDE